VGCLLNWILSVLNFAFGTIKRSVMSFVLVPSTRAVFPSRLPSPPYNVALGLYFRHGYATERRTF